MYPNKIGFDYAENSGNLVIEMLSNPVFEAWGTISNYQYFCIIIIQFI